MALPIQGDLVARGLARVLLQRQAREEDAKNRMEYLIEKERLRRKREEARREERLNTERSATRKAGVKEKAGKKLNRLKQIELAIGKENLQTYFGREQVRERMVYDPLNKRFLRVPELAEGINRERIANIGLGTPSQQFTATERFRESGGGRIIDTSEETRRRQLIRKENVEFKERESKLANKSNKGKHDSQVRFIEVKIRNSEGNEKAFWQDKLRKISETQYDYFLNLPKYSKKKSEEKTEIGGYIIEEK